LPSAQNQSSPSLAPFGLFLKEGLN